MIVVEYKGEEKIRKDVEPLFLSAFPFSERPTPEFYFNSFSNKRNRLFAFYLDNTFIGFSSVSIFEDICYIFFLAVQDKYRNQGYGSKILSLLKDMFKEYTLLLCYEEVDEKYEDYENRLKRSLFYQRNGFVINPLKTNEFGVVFQTVRFGPKVVTFKDYQNIFLLGFGEFALKHLKEA